MSQDVTLEAVRFLATCGILKPPTDFHALLEARQLGLSFFQEPPTSELPDHLRDSIRALIDIPDKHIFISSKLHEKKKRFASFHEIGHDVLPWHQDIFKHKCSELDLSPQTRKQFDIEANAFAAECLFQGDRFLGEALDHRFQMSSIVNLADKYDVSYESALRRFVEFHPEACAGLVCEPTSKIIRFGEGRPLKIKYLVRSKSFPWSPYKRDLEIPRNNILTSICDSTTKKPVRTDVVLTFPPNGEIKCRAHALFTGYKALVLLRPHSFRGSGHTVPLSISSPS